MQNFDCNTFCDRAKELFKDIGQIELSRRIGISQGVISAIKNGKPKAPSADTVYRIAKAFNVSADWLLGMSNNKTTNQATKELCGTLGLTDIAIEHLQNDQELIVRDAINFLFWQHEKAEKGTSKDDSAESQMSLLNLLSNFCDLKNATQDLMIELRTDGKVTVRLSNLSTNTLNEKNAFEGQMTGLKGSTCTSLIEAVTKDIIYWITEILHSIAIKQSEKIEWEQWRKERG